MSYSEIRFLSYCPLLARIKWCTKMHAYITEITVLLMWVLVGKQGLDCDACMACVVHEVVGGWRAWWCKWTISPVLWDKARSGLDTGEVAELTERGLPSLVTVPVRGFHSSFTLFHRHSGPSCERTPVPLGVHQDLWVTLATGTTCHAEGAGSLGGAL